MSGVRCKESGRQRHRACKACESYRPAGEGFRLKEEGYSPAGEFNPTAVGINRAAARFKQARKTLRPIKTGPLSSKESWISPDGEKLVGNAHEATGEERKYMSKTSKDQSRHYDQLGPVKTVRVERT